VALETCPDRSSGRRSLEIIVSCSIQFSSCADVDSGDYFLTRKAEYTLSLIREVDRLRMEKLILSNPHSSSSVIREQDLNLAILRASVGTSAENDRWVEKLRFKLERGSLRPFMPSAAPPKHTHEDNDIRALFSSFLLGAPMTMTSTMGWPMDLFITPPAMSAYIDINVYLTAIRDTHLKVLSCWSSLSASQRRRRRWTGPNEGGTRSEIQRRRNLARSSWGIVRAMLFFLDQLLGHFMVDIIDVQHRRLLDSLEEVNIAAKQGVNSRPGSMRGSVARAGSPASRFGTASTAGHPSTARNWEGESPNDYTQDSFEAQTIRTRAPPSSARRPAHAVFLDFLTLR
jgi:gamma-tubulin complex component 4